MPWVETWRPKTFECQGRFDRTGSSRRFGVELEYQDSPNYRQAEQICLFGCKPDGSTDGPEFYSPPMKGDWGLEQCEKLCDFAMEQGFETDDGTGYHLHLDLSDESVDRIKRVAVAYHHTHEMWTGFVPYHRRHSNWCSSTDWSASDFEGISTQRELRNAACYPDRYCWLNWNAYLDHGTCELRIHESSTDKTNVCNWIIANLRFLDAAADMEIGQITRIFSGKTRNEKFREMSMMIQDYNVTEHLRRRYRRFTSRAVDAN